MSQDVSSLVELEIKCPSVKSLCWDGDTLIDLAGGYSRIHLDGRTERSGINFGYRFDYLTSLRSGDDIWCILYENRGTKGLILKNCQFVREINRSYYCADDYDYPVTLVMLPSGRVAVIHCPDEYNRLEIEDAETGARLAARDGGDDFFHSRLQVSPGGKYLLSAGWVWHPWCEARVFDLAHALEDPATLDGEGLFLLGPDEAESAVFSEQDRLVVGMIHDHKEPELGVWDLGTKSWISRRSLHEPVGTIFASGSRAFSLYGHPKVVDLWTGQVLQRWEHISTGSQRGPIDLRGATRQAAFDACKFRLAVTSETGITVLAAPPRQAPELATT
jgi:hypothetical protein